MKRIIGSLLLITLFAGCSPKLFSDLRMRPASSVSTCRNNLLPVFDQYHEGKYYNVQISFKENEMSGLMALNQIEKGVFRLVMMTAFGMPVFDFTISRDEFTVNSCMERLNRKVVLNLLEKDFRTLFLLNIPEKFNAIMYLHPQKKDWQGYSVKANDGECDYLLYPKGNSFVRTIQNGGAIKRMTAVFDEQVITIQHNRLGLSIVINSVD